MIETMILLMIAVYFLPAIVAIARKKKDSVAIFMLNFLTGWTFIGWVIAFIWSLTNDKK